MPRITLIMLVWNAFEHTKLTLKSLYENTDNFDLIIFDNGSRSQVKEYLQKFQSEHSNVKLILSNENLGTWKARHIAAGLVQTELMGTIDNDVVFEPNWLEKMATRFDDPQVGQVGVLKLFVHMNHPYLSGNLPQAWRECEKQTKDLQEQLDLFLQHKTIPEFREDLLAFNKDFSESLDCPPDCISSCCMLTRTELFTRSDIDDPAYAQAKYGFEDMDYSWALYKAGYKIILDKEVYTHHFEHSSVEDNNHDINAKDQQANTVHFYHKWQYVIADWIKAQLQDGISLEEIKKHFVIRIMLKIIPEQVPASIAELIG